MVVTFQSTRPVRGATPSFQAHRSSTTFQSTRPVRGATLDFPVQKYISTVSIHAPRAGRDPPLFRGGMRIYGFNPRAPCGARHFDKCSLNSPISFNPRAPCGARQIVTGYAHMETSFNPRAPCGARLIGFCRFPVLSVFQSTRPVRGATVPHATTTPRGRVSIHAPHAGRDHHKPPRAAPLLVSIHAPHAGRDLWSRVRSAL